MTPMMEQYFEIKRQYEGYLLFYRLGDFYEMFFDDAVLASRELELTLTGRDCGEAERAPMCGVPFHSADTYIARLIEKGYKIAICEQTEDPALAKGLVRREVVRVITPGTLIESSMLPEQKNNYICSLYYSGVEFGLCFADVSTARVSVTLIDGDNMDNRLINELATYMPREAISNVSAVKFSAAADFLVSKNAIVNDNQPQKYEYDTCLARIKAQFGESLREEILSSRAIVCATGALLSYLSETQKNDLPNI